MSERAKSDLGFVVVTGTSTGIGAATVSHLQDSGFSVFAGVREDEDAAALLRRFPNTVTPIMLDITDESMIMAAVEFVNSRVRDQGLAGIVNNAGIVKPGPLEFQPLVDFREQLEVNLIGHVAVTQAFLPLIRAGRGRIVNVGSIGGRLVLPLHGAYSASKFAMEAVTDALRIELRQWNLHVSQVDPGATDTAIFAKTLAAIDSVKKVLGDRGLDRYDRQLDAIRQLVIKTADDADPANNVARAISDALMSTRPKTRYLAGHQAKTIAAIARTMPTRFKDLLVAHEANLPGRDD